MKVADLITYLQGCNQDANVVVVGNGKGGSPFIDIDKPDEPFWDGKPYEDEDCEPDESLVPSTIKTDGDEGFDYRDVVVIFASYQLY